MRLLRLLLGFALIRWLRDLVSGAGRDDSVPLPPVVPVRVEDPDAGGAGGGPDTSRWPEFDYPAFRGALDIPPIPACDTVYLLVYTDAFAWGGATQRDAVRQARRRGPRLLAWAQDQAKRYCARNPLCTGVVELDHLVQWAVFELAGEDVIELTLSYFFRCTHAGAGVRPPPQDQTLSRPYRSDSAAEPWCNGEYTYVIHERTQVAFGCQGADARAAERAHERDLLAAARADARLFCARVPEPICRQVHERGWHVTHRCVHTRNPAQAWVLSTLIYRFDCAALA